MISTYWIHSQMLLITLLLNPNCGIHLSTTTSKNMGYKYNVIYYLICFNVSKEIIIRVILQNEKKFQIKI